MVRMEGLTFVFEYGFVYNHMAFVADVTSKTRCSFPKIATSADGAAPVADEALVGQSLGANVAPETVGMPRRVHRSDDSSGYELFAPSTAGGEESVEVVFAIFPTLEFIEDAILERLKTLSADEAGGMPGFTAASFFHAHVAHHSLLLFVTWFFAKMAKRTLEFRFIVVVVDVAVVTVGWVVHNIRVMAFIRGRVVGETRGTSGLGINLALTSSSSAPQQR